MIPAHHLRTLRNQAPVLSVIFELGIPTEMRGSRLTFRCPDCGGFHTAVNYRANLTRCFPCKRNFNPIDLAMAERAWGFLEAVKYLESLLSVSE